MLVLILDFRTFLFVVIILLTFAGKLVLPCKILHGKVIVVVLTNSK